MTSPLTLRLAIFTAFLNALVACCAPGGIVMLGCTDPVGHRDHDHAHHGHHHGECPVHSHATDVGPGHEHHIPTPPHIHLCDDDQTIVRPREVESSPIGPILLFWACDDEGGIAVRRVIAPAPRPPDVGGGRPPPWIATTILLI